MANIADQVTSALREESRARDEAGAALAAAADGVVAARVQLSAAEVAFAEAKTTALSAGWTQPALSKVFRTVGFTEPVVSPSAGRRAAGRARSSSRRDATPSAPAPAVADGDGAS